MNRIAMTLVVVHAQDMGMARWGQDQSLPSSTPLRRVVQGAKGETKPYHSSHLPLNLAVTLLSHLACIILSGTWGRHKVVYSLWSITFAGTIMVMHKDPQMHPQNPYIKAFLVFTLSGLVCRVG